MPDSENLNPPSSQSQDTINDIEMTGGDDLVSERDDSGEFDDEQEGAEGDHDVIEEKGAEQDEQDGKRSEVWLHFTTITLPNGLRKNKCNHCKKLYSYQNNKKGDSVQRGKKGGTTSHLLRHLRDHCPFREKVDLKSKGEATDSHSTKSKTIQSYLQASVTSEGENSTSNFTFSFEKIKCLAAHMIFAHEYPFSIVEHKVFNVFFKAYSLYYQKISRYVVRNECFKVYEEEKDRLKGILRKVSKVSRTTHCWSSDVQKIGYMVITLHYIDRNWSLQKRVLSFNNVPPPHNGSALANEVHRVCKIFGISDKVSSVTVDNASANDVSISILKTDFQLSSKLVLDGKLFHVRCCAHIINLLVREGLKEIKKITQKVREGVKYLFGSEGRLRSFNVHRINLKLPPNKLLLDNNTRWNSTFDMLSTAYKYRKCFDKFGVEDEKFGQSYCPSDFEWEEVNVVCEFLEVFWDVTHLISGTNYPTVNLFLLEMSRIKELINAQLDISCKKHMQSMALGMAAKYDKYWEECDLLLCFGSILDPRYKKNMIEYTYKSMYPSDHETKTKMVFDKFAELFKHYAKIFGAEKDKEPESYSCSANFKTPPTSSVGKRKFDEFLMTLQTKGKEKSDLDMYYEEVCFPNDAPNFDALAWWKGNEGKYQVLSKIAMDILSIPITTVASESTFSAGGRVIDKRRASMRRDTVEVLLCGGDWVKEMYGIRSTKEGNDPNEDPIELEYENEYDMKDPESEIIDFTVDGAGDDDGDGADSIPSQAQGVNRPKKQITQSVSMPSRSKPPINSKKSQKRRKT